MFTIKSPLNVGKHTKPMDPLEKISMQHLGPKNPCFFPCKHGAFRIGSRQSRWISGFTSASCRSSREQLGILAKSLSHEIAESSLSLIRHKLKYPKKNMDLIWKKMGWDMSFIKTFIQKTTIQRKKSLALWLDFSDRSTTVNSVNHSRCHVYYVVTSIY